VWLRYVEPVHITNVFAKPRDVLTDMPKVAVDVHMRNQSDQPRPYMLHVELLDPEGQHVAGYHETEPGTFDADSTQVIPVRFTELFSVDLWTMDDPRLYTLRVELRDSDDQPQDVVMVHFGFREAEFRKDGGFYLNGERVDLIGLNRHQTYPYIGAAAPARLQRRDADIVKFELGCNIVRTSHYPQSPHFLDRCDELGLLVFEEIPGWQHIGDADWQALSLRDVRAMIERDWNHPSIVLWGVRINESPDDHDFYTATNALAHKLDPTRQTGGVRYHRGSEFLEDVYTYNDFSNDVLEPEHTPHMVTEFNGHMFPTKAWDQEERLVEHALRHARIQNKQIGMARVAGAIGWCAFDYNTHVEFGSGDRICYHGVMDIFRLPKYAAYMYGSQIDPAQRVVLHAATLWAKGERSVGGFEPTWVFTNCDEIEVFVGDESLGRFQPDRDTFPHLPHPPVKITGFKDFWGQKRHFDLRVVGYLNGAAVAEHWIAADGIPHALELHVDDDQLQADNADMTRLVFRIVDRFGNRLPFSQAAVSFEIEGPAELIGENPFALMGGQAALYIKAGHEAGKVTVRAITARLAPAEVTLDIMK
jgi:beta-galactosidase